MSLQYWKVQISKKFLPKKFYHRNPAKIPFVAKKLQKALMEGDDMLIMPRNEIIEVDKPLSLPKEEVVPTKVLEHFIREACYICIVNTCLCRDSLNCKDYPVSPGCIYMGEAARDVHPKLAKQVTADEAIEHVRRSQKLGLVNMIGRSKLDCVTHSIGPGNKLMAICNCCPCCCVARGIGYVSPILGETLTRIPGMNITVTDRCVGCGTCVTEKSCIFFALGMENDRAEIDPDKCRGCSRCVSICPNNAIEVDIVDENYIEHTIERLSKAVDVT